ncbi:hypothetical protein TRFO_21608 [Tritrichomonas foetus]|uniref:Uncharacterized protein n=1 Tax=Tritrichomonas foetus TaxID=1144522 RepID=A0A1J4KIA0_9EUKA|nr:hypothetical protein TRFO_21608 [Tritrichomonas foetus]|eukprot:OHT09548.1 hypothetical protein TRFO_21608 [Tritrichomonas foetus]
MLKSGRAIRKSKVMTMKANPPTLVPPVRQTSYMDYESLSPKDKAVCARMIDEFRRTREISCPNSALYQKLLCFLREQRRIAASQGNFNKAGEIDNFMRELSQFYHENSLFKAKAEEVAVAENQYMTEQAHLMEVREKWSIEVEKQRQHRDCAIKRIDEFCDQQMNDYDTKIPDTLPASHSKLSPELLNIKDRERHMIGCRMYKEAAELHKEFEKRQKEELQRRREEYYQSFEISRNLLEKRTNRKRTAIRSDWERKMNHTEHIRNKETRPLTAGVGYLESKLIDNKAEYIGEDDPIINNEKAIYDSKTYRVSPPMMTRGVTPRTMVSATRSLESPPQVVSTKKMSATMMRQNHKLDSNRWPR